MPSTKSLLTLLLLDTHAFIWWRSKPAAIRPATRERVATADTVYVSHASAWETAIKVGLGKMRFEGNFREGIEDSRFQPLPITFDHIDRVATLPRHHGDPFDRMLVAQAQIEALTLVTGDRVFARYGLPILWT